MSTTDDKALLTTSSETNKITNMDSIEDDKIVHKENLRFTKHSPFVTLLIMCLGPLSMLFQVFGEIIDMAFISNRFKSEPGAHAVEIIGFTAQIHAILVAIGLLFGQSAVARVSHLLGAGEREAAAHLISDILYLDIVFSILFSASFVFVVKPFLHFVGATEELVSKCFLYVVCALVALPFTTLSSLGQYFLQSIGSALLSALVKLVTYALQLSVLSPLFLFAIKVPVVFMKLGSILSNSLVGISVYILIYRGKFSLKPKLRDILDKSSPELKVALWNSIPIFIHALIGIFPSILILKCLTGVNKEISTSIAGVFAVYNSVYPICNTVPSAFSQAFLSAATHAWGAHNYKRVVQLLLWTMLICLLLPASISVAIIFGKTQIIKIFLHEEAQIKLGERMLPIPFYTITLQGFALCASMMMIVVGKPILSFIPQCVQFIILCVGCNLIAAHCNNDPVKIMYIYNISDIAIFVLLLLFMIYPIRLIKKKMNELHNLNTQALLE